MMPLTNGRLERDHSNEVIEIGPDTLMVLDLDRTLIDSDRLVDVTLLSLEDSLDAVQDQSAIDAIELVRARERQEKGNSFAYLEALQKEIGAGDAKWVDGLASQVIGVNRDEQGTINSSFINQIMLPGAIDLLRKVGRLGADWMIMTAGQKLTQQYKLTLLRQILAEIIPDNDPLSHLITDPDHQLSKVEMINQSFVGDASSLFDPVVLSRHSTAAVLAPHIASRRYDQAVLLDDKLSNLESTGEANPRVLTELVRASNDPSRPGRSLKEIGSCLRSAS